MKPGEWFAVNLGEQFPEWITVWRGHIETRELVRTISRHQALALWRWHGIKGIYYSYKIGADRWRDVIVCGDPGIWFDGTETSVIAHIRVP